MLSRSELMALMARLREATSDVQVAPALAYDIDSVLVAHFRAELAIHLELTRQWQHSPGALAAMAKIERGLRDQLGAAETRLIRVLPEACAALSREVATRAEADEVWPLFTDQLLEPRNTAGG